MDKEEEEVRWVGELIRKEVSDWDNEVMASARFKAFSGQRSDWEPRYFFWRDLIINLARHLRLFIIRPSQVKNIWFNRGGLAPLCLDHVLIEMYNAGDILHSSDLVDPTSGRLSQVFKRVVYLVGLSRSSSSVDFTEDHLILSTLLKEKAFEVVKILSDNYWTSSCIITMKKFQELCGGSKEAYAVLSHLSASGKAKYLLINKKGSIEGVKISLTPGAVSDTMSLDYNVLHLTWTAEKLQQQLYVIDQRYERSRKLALASLRSGNKIIARRHASVLKLSSQSRGKCTALLNRVEEVLRVIDDTESSKEVSEAIQIGARAIKENKISLEEVQVCLQELDESIKSQKQIENVLAAGRGGMDAEDIEDEFKKLELEVGSPVSKHGVGETEATETAPDSLINAFSNLSFTDGADTALQSVVMQASMESTRTNISSDLELEA
ncbi:hypothetical protein LguiA_011265 [Lonicera macranthoides]